MTTTTHFLYRIENPYIDTPDQAFDNLKANAEANDFTGYLLVNNLPFFFIEDMGGRFINAITFWKMNQRNMFLANRDVSAFPQIAQKRDHFLHLLHQIDNNIDLLNQWTDTFYSGDTALCLILGRRYTFVGTTHQTDKD